MVACIDVASNGSTNPADNPTATTFFTQMFSNLPQSNLILRIGSTSLPNDFLFVDTVNNPWLELVDQDPPKQIPQESQGNLTFESMALFLPCQ